MSSGEVDLAWAWNDAAVQSAAGRRADQDASATPTEGLSTWVCGYVLLKDAPGSADKAYDFLSAVNDPDVADYMVKDLGLRPRQRQGHGGGRPGGAAAKRAMPTSEKFVDKTLFQSPVPTELKQQMIAEFEKIKAGY